MDRGWNDTTCYGPERSRLGQQPYDRGRIAPTDRRSCFECGQEGHISRYCPRYLDRISGGVYSRWPNEHWPPARPPTSFHKESSYSRGENNRENSSYGRRAPFDGHDKGETYYRPRDGGDRGRDNESSRGVDMGVTSNANVRERESRSSRSSVRKPHDGSHQTSVGHRRDEQKGGKGDPKDEGKDGKSQRVEKHIDAKICTSSDCVVTCEGNGEIQRGGQVSKSSPRGPHSAVEAIGKHGIPVAEDGARASTKDVDNSKSVSGSDLRGSVTDKDRCRRYENGGKRGQKHSKEEPARLNDGSSSRSSSKVPLSVLCSKAIENGAEGVTDTKACLDSTSFISAPKIETALPLCSLPGHKKELKDDVHTERRTDVSSTSLHQDSLPQDVNDVGKIRTCDDTPNLSKSDLPVGVDFPKDGHGDKEREVVVQAFVSADAKRPSVCDEGQSKSGKGRRATRWDTPKASPIGEDAADYPRSRDRFERSAVSSKETVADAIQDADKSKRKDAVKVEKPTVSNKDTVAAPVLRQSEVVDRRVFVKEEKGSRNKDPTGDASEGFGRKPPSGKGGAEQDSKRSDCDISQPGPRGAGKDGSDGERDPSMVLTESGPSSWYRRRGQFRERDYEPDWREQDSGFDVRGREWEVDRHVNCFERGAEKELPRKHLEQGSLSPSRIRNDSRERDSTNDAFTGYRSREVSVEIFSDKNGQAIYTERVAQKPTLKTLNGGLKPEYRRRFETIDGRNGFGNTLALEYREVEDGREQGGCGAEWRHSRSMEAQPVRSQFKPPYANLIGAHYSCVVNARCEAHRSPSPMAISPPLCQVSASRQDPLPSSQGEETSCIIREPLSTGWLYNDRHGNLQGPVDLGQLREMFGSGLLQADHLVCREGTNEWITLEHAGSPANWLPGSPGNKLLSSLSSSGISQASPQSYDPCTQDRLKDDHLAVEHADNDIYPPGTGISNDNSVDRDFEDLRIDERVEKLMQGFTYIPGKEGEAVYEALSSAAMRVRAALGYETDQLNEESPRSHGGFANLGDQWKDGDFGSDVQGLDVSGNEQHVQKADDKLEEKGMEVVSDARVEVGSVPKPLVPVTCRKNRHLEKRPELWTWPARGGDWKLCVYPVENAQPVVGEKGPQVPMIAKKVVLNGGHPFCDGKFRELRGDVRDQRKRDPRRMRELQIQAEDSTKNNNWSKLEVPKFAQAFYLKTGIPPQEPNQHLATTPKGAHAATLNLQTSTPGAQLAFKPSKPSSKAALAPGTGTKSVGQVIPQPTLSKGVRTLHPSSKHELVLLKKNATISKYRGLPRAGGVSEGRMKPASERIMKQSGRVEAALRPRSSDHPQGLDRESLKIVSKQVFSKKDLPSKETLSLKAGKWFYLDGAGHELGPFSYAEVQTLVSTHKLIEGSTIYRKADDIWIPVSRTSLHGTVTFPVEPGVHSEDGVKGLVFPPTNQFSESSTRQSSGNDQSRYSPSEPLPPAVSMSESGGFTLLHNEEACVPGASNPTSEPVSFHGIHPQFLGFTRGKLHEYVMKSYKSALLPAALYEGLEKWFQAKEKEKVSLVPLTIPQGSPLSSVPTPGIERSREQEDIGISSPRCERHFQYQSTLTGRRSAHGTPSSSYDDAAKTMETEGWSRATSVGQNGKTVGEEFSPSKRKAWALEDSKLHRRSFQKRRLLDSEESDGDEKAGDSSRAALVGGSCLPRLEDDNPFRISDMVPQVLLSGTDEKCWSTLNLGTLRMILWCLRRDVLSLTNASATCKSWRAAGMICKSELKSVDLSCLPCTRLDAILEALPGFGASRLRKVKLKGGLNVKPESLAELLRGCPSISVVEVDSLEPFKELRGSFPKVRWVTELSGVQVSQSPRELAIGKRSDVPLKTRSLKVLGESKGGFVRELFSRDCEDFEVHLVSDSASKVRSPTGYGSTLNTDLETTANDSVHDSELTHNARTLDGAKYLKLNNGIKKLESSNGFSKTVKREHGDGISHEPVLKRRTPTVAHRKHEKASHKKGKPLIGSQRSIQDKLSVSTVKTEVASKSYSVVSVMEGERRLEKEVNAIFRAMIEADADRIFQPANGSTDGKGGGSNSGKMDLLVIERKLRSGLYSNGKSGFKAFREDVNLLIRIAFRNPKESLSYTTGEKIFKLTHSHFSAFENQIAVQSSVETQTQSKSFGARPYGKGEKGRLKAPLMAPHRPGKKRKLWGDEGVQKGKLWSVRKSRQGDASDFDTDSDSERDTRRFSKSRKERSWESDNGESSEDDEDGFMEEDDEETETEPSDSDIPSESEGEDGIYEADNYDSEEEQEIGYLDWGARMTKAAMVPPVTRKYVVIEEYRIVADKERVERKMRVELPKNFPQVAVGGDPYSHLDYPEIKEYQPRKRLGEEVLEQEVYGIDPFTHNLLLDTMPVETTYITEAQKQQFIEERLLLVLNKEGSKYTGTGRAPMEYPLDRVVQRIASEAEICKDWALYDFADQLLVNMKARQQKDKFVAYRKGLGVVCNKQQGLEKDEFVVEFFGEVYPPWRWYEKQDGIRSLQKKDKDPTPEFYNIYYERPKGDDAGYDLLVVDAMHKANFASRLCHSCRPNCEAKITAVNNTYIIGVYSLKPIKRGEELTFDYNSVTESKEEYNNAVCLCGSQGCRGSYLNLTGSGTFEEVIARDHGLLERHRLLLNSCSNSAVTDEEMKEMRQAGLGRCVLSGLPKWAVKYTASLVRFMNFEKEHLPAELLKDYDLKRKQGVVEGSNEGDAEITTEGVYNQRLQNLTITLDKVRHILTELYQEPSLAPPPVRRLDQREMVQWIWKKDNSVVNELLQCLAPHLQKETLSEFKAAVGRNAPNDSGNNLHNALIWLRDALRRLPATCKARHDAAADLIHLYAYTKCFFTLEDYDVVESPPMLITPLDLGSKHSHTGNRQWRKVYSKEYVWGQLINWFKQNVADPGASLAKSSRGCLVLPDISSCYSKSMQHDFRQGYGPKHREKMFFHMENKPQQRWPKSKVWSQFWSFKNERGVFGSPMLDSVLEGKSVREDMMRWLKFREVNFVGPWDEQ